MPRAGLGTDTVVAAGADLADEIGFAGLSMGQLAERVGVRTPSLYKHVASQDDLNRRIAQRWHEREAGSIALDASAFGVALVQRASPYQQNVRAGKYGVLFIALTFVAFFLFEVLRGLRVHPVQYLLVGLALCTFYVVLLALSEQAGFAWAYVVAAAASVAMIGGYAVAVLRQRRAGWMLGGLLGLVYALLYGLVTSEDHALLMGALALLATVALLMYLTRRVDWYAMAPRRAERPM